MNEAPYIKSSEQVVELSLRGILLSIFLTILLATSNAYLALKIGILTSASIPAAVLSMTVLKFFRRSSVLENNLVQTAASAGEAVAGGLVYTIPALVIIHYWHGFPYWENVLIAFLGGTLGVLFSIPLRRVLVKQSSLPFPEGRAVAEILKASEGGSIKELLMGSLLGAGIELFQTGFKIISNGYQLWLSLRNVLVGFGVGFSATLVGAGYLIGFELCFSIFLGAVAGWLFAVPVFSAIFPTYMIDSVPQDAVLTLWNSKIRYLGIGAMLAAGLIAFLRMIKPLSVSIKQSIAMVKRESHSRYIIPRVERDIPLLYLLLLGSAISAILFVFLQVIFPLSVLGLNPSFSPTFVFCSVLYIFIVGFVFCVITAYFSGMVGVSASPGSSVLIASMLMVGGVLAALIEPSGQFHITAHQIQAAEAITIIIGAVVMGSAAIANDNIQDLKVGHLLGATPWKQQVMLLLGVAVASLVIPPIMELLFNVYGIADVLPNVNMDPANSLPAPPAALMAAITTGLFHHGLPWRVLMCGAIVILVVLLVNKQLHRRGFKKQISLLGFAIGMYLPMVSSIPIFIGGLFSLMVHYYLDVYQVPKGARPARLHKGMLLACGLVAGAALMDVMLAIPFSMAHSPDIIAIGRLWPGSALEFAILVILALMRLFYVTVTKP